MRQAESNTRRAVALAARRTAAGRDVVRAASAGAAADHPVRLLGLAAQRGDGSTRPTVVERRDDDFIAALFAQLARDGGLNALLHDAEQLARSRRQSDGALKLYPPIQRVFNLVLVEACCAQPGWPRLDPQRIDSAGLVLRRRAGAAQWQSWELRDDKPLGWRTLPAAQALLREGTIDADDDPAAALRTKRASVGHAWLDARLRAQRLDAGSERVVPLHPLPAALCERLGRTLLVALLPLGSDQLADRGAAPATPALPPFDAQDLNNLANHLVHYLRAGALKRLPRAGQPFDATWGSLTDGDDASAARFARLVLQLRSEFDAFGSTGSAANLRAALAPLTVLRLSADAKAAIGGDEALAVQTLLDLEPMFPQQVRNHDQLEFVLRMRIDPGSITALQRVRRFLAGVTRESALALLQAAEARLALEPGSVTMPDWWLPLSEPQSQRIVAACAAAARERFEREFAAAPATGGAYSSPDDIVAARCFVRLRPHDPRCPPELVWGDYSEPLRVAPWWESAGVKPRIVPLPDLKPAALKALKPNVAFALPASLANLVHARNLDALKDGDSPDDAGIALDFVCGFNIPIITICAFVVLSIFLGLLNIVFQWLPFVKICIPLPKLPRSG